MAKLSREEFDRRYWKGQADTVAYSVRREFYSDYRESGQSFAAYVRSTSTPVDEQYRRNGRDGYGDQDPWSKKSWVKRSVRTVRSTVAKHRKGSVATMYASGTAIEFDMKKRNGNGLYTLFRRGRVVATQVPGAWPTQDTVRMNRSRR